MDAATLRQLLANTNTHDAATRNAAEESLRQSFATNPAQHLLLLSQELADEASPTVQTRALAGLTLKNHMTSRDNQQAMKLANDWMALPPELRGQVKNNSTVALASGQKEVRLTSAQVISKIATIELPKVDGTGRSQWEELMPALLSYVVQPEATPQGMAKKEAALNTIGYICEEIAQLETDCLHSKSNEILTAVVAGMRTDEQDLNVKLAAVKALQNALEFASTNFQVQTERDYIMTVICEACNAPTDEVKESAYQCLCRIADLYYEQLPAYIQTLLEMSLTAIKTQSDAVARQAIAFWSSVCDMEYEFLSTNENGNHKFIIGAHSFLIPVLLGTMAQQEDGQDEDSFNKSTEAAACLAAVASIIENPVVGVVWPWVEQCLSSQDWRQRESAVLAFGCIMDGPDDTMLSQYIDPVLPVLFKYLVEDSEDLVKNSSAWTIMRICEMAPAAIKDDKIPFYTEKILDAVLGSEPATANHLCWAIHHIANYVRSLYETPTCPPNVLSALFTRIIKTLMDTGDRQDATEGNLRANAYEAINVVLTTADDNVKKQFLAPALLSEFGDRLNSTFTMPVLNADDLNTRSEWQSFLCGALQTCINNVPVEVLVQLDPTSNMTMADKFMHLFLQVFSSQNTTSAQEALLAVGSVATALPEGGFDRYMQSFGPMLVTCISTTQEPPLCMLAVTTTSDIARQLDAKMLAYTDPIVQALLTTLAHPEVDSQLSQVHDYIKPAIYSCFGDIAMAIGAGMDKYLQYWFAALQEGCKTAVQLEKELAEPEGFDEDKRVYLNSLMEGVLDGYTGIVYGLKAAAKSVPAALDAFLTPVALQQGCLQLIQALSADVEKAEGVLRTAAGLVGDLAETYGAKVTGMLQVPQIQEVVKQAMESQDSDTKDIGKWSYQKLAAAG
mmetsp:Transcript_3159/g.6379  ORF Transcript_3159/g.6379 Transcript_3159/m.6379 type:complete len:902 (-) Transcript_3159:347-3052(-)|eukprot:CAMPEP_0181325376 /NCGR_PEP_ID=MMETSP1101-20121128/20888_1 /TAXON_ID=46948 /ORGANISM="Rhodomonas abbreviata, Strain Caron Lab Isolate" /LENGTH=901 /DNA_ID=CAMNT_0023433671 /DNA_START=106 /DNA_END=2811 /DNA_ORIENTATION=+